MSPRTASPQSVERIFAILGHLATERAGDTLAALARRAGAPKSSVLNLLSGMVESGYVLRDGQARYHLGPSMITLAMSVVAKRGLSELARPVLERLVERTGETALVGTLAPDGEVAMYVDLVESRNPVRYTVSLGERRELYCTAIGKLLLAYMASDRREKYLRACKLQAFTQNTITSVRELRAALAEIRDAGLSRTDAERVAGASAVAAPIFGAEGTFVAGIVVAGPSERMRARAKENEAALSQAAKSLSIAIGGKESAAPDPEPATSRGRASRARTRSD
jgi:DNA-binding IclR family transcriptional regulator